MVPPTLTSSEAYAVSTTWLFRLETHSLRSPRHFFFVTSNQPENHKCKWLKAASATLFANALQHIPTTYMNLASEKKIQPEYPENLWLQKSQFSRAHFHQS